MRILLLISVLFLSACSPTFQKGDCVSYKSQERWENDSIWKVVEVGENNYRTEWIKPKHMAGTFQTESFRYLDNYAHKVNCPKGE